MVLNATDGVTNRYPISKRKNSSSDNYHIMFFTKGMHNLHILFALMNIALSVLPMLSKMENLLDLQQYRKSIVATCNNATMQQTRVYFFSIKQKSTHKHRHRER